MTEQQWIIIGIAALGIAVILGALSGIMQWYYRKKGVDGERKIHKILTRFAGIRRFRVLRGLTLPGKNGPVQIGHILIGFFGVMIVTEKNSAGNIYGTGWDKKWVRVVTKNEQEKRGSFKNPVLHSQACLEAVREVLTTNKIYKTSIENYVVFTSPKAVLNTERGLPVMNLKAFKKLLKREKYSADGDVDVERVAQVLLDASQQSGQ